LKGKLKLWFCLILLKIHEEYYIIITNSSLCA
jgi:hypothetical protein